MPPETAQGATQTCPKCHQPVQQSYYFCPNCGENLRPTPLPVDALAQAKLYAHSIVLPMLCFITVNRWQGQKYLKNADPKAKQMGTVAWALLTLSTFLTLYFVYRWTVDTIAATQSALNADMNF